MTDDPARHSTAPGPDCFRFDDVVVDAGAHTLERAGELHAVEPKIFDTLLVLLRHAGQLVPRDELLDAVWGHRHVTPGVLTRAIAQLRDALGDDAHHPRYIQTQHAVGYRFIGELIPCEAAGEDASPPVAESPSSPSVAPPPPAAEHAIFPPERRVSDTAVPRSLAGDRRRSDRGRRWAWPLVGLLAAGLGIATWRDYRAPDPTQAAATPIAASIAVLPFTSLDPKHAGDYFAAGLSSEMLDALSGVKGLTVAAPVMPELADYYQRDVKALGKVLGVATVLDATVQHDGDRVHINARLSDTHTGYTVWSHSYDQDAGGIFETQVDIATQVVGELQQILPTQRTALARRLAPTRSAAAFGNYLEGIGELLQPRSGGNNQRAITSFSKALAVDAGFARAQAGICRAEVRDFADHNNADAYARAAAACKRAQDMQPGLGVVNVALGELHLFRSEYATATDFYMRAMSDPGSRPAAYVGLAIAQGRQGRTAQALENFNKALALRPGEPTVYSQLGYQYYLSGDLPKSIDAYRKATELAPGNVDFWSYLGGVYITAGKKAEAKQVLERSLAIGPSYPALTNLAEIDYFNGDYAKSVELNRQAVRLDPSDYEAWGNLGQSLLAIPGRGEEAKDAFREGAQRAQRYVALKSDDALANALLGWYSANLGDAKDARSLVARSEGLGGQPDEVALANAQTLALLGDASGAAKRIATARAAGIAEFRIADNPALRGVPGIKNRQESGK